MKYPYQIKSAEEYNKVYKDSIQNPEDFWANVAEHFTWHKKWDRVLEWDFNRFNVRWFDGGMLNVTENCLDRHLAENGDQAAIIWEPNDPNESAITLTYKELHHQVMCFAQVLLNNGIQKGDRVCIYMGMTPELAIATLACARIGAIHSIIFGGFSAQSIADRVNDAQARIIITSDGAYRANKVIPLKPVVDDALVHCPSVNTVIVSTRTKTPVSMMKGRDVWWNDEIENVLDNDNIFVPAVSMQAEDELFILYTSGSTGQPKGVVHTCAGYLIWANYTFVNVFQYQPGQIHFCTADIGWITGHSYILYGPLSAGATTVIFEGVPTYPDAGRLWEIVDKYHVDILYTAPTAIRSLMSYGTEPFIGKSLKTLKVLGSVGEPINEEAWQWYHKHAGRGQTPVVDTWWQTETGGILISNLAGVTPHKATFATKPLPGVQPILVDEKGNELTDNDISGFLCIKAPWPGMLRTTYNDHSRCQQTYFSMYPGLYFTSDGAYRNEYGEFRITGRVDDVLNVSGHRIGTAELENAINLHTGVVESAIVGYPHDVKGQGIYAFIIFSGELDNPELTKQDITQTVNRLIGPIAKPDKIQFVTALPKTRSGKIMRRILRKIAEDQLDAIGDTSTLLDPNVVNDIIKNKL